LWATAHSCTPFSKDGAATKPHLRNSDRMAGGIRDEFSGSLPGTTGRNSQPSATDEMVACNRRDHRGSSGTAVPIVGLAPLQKLDFRMGLGERRKKGSSGSRALKAILPHPPYYKINRRQEGQYRHFPRDWPKQSIKTILLLQTFSRRTSPISSLQPLGKANVRRVAKYSGREEARRKHEANR